MKRRKLLLVCSSGGHLYQLYRLKEFWIQHPHIWVTLRTEDATCLLSHENVIWAFSPTTRNIMNFVNNLFLAIRLMKKERPSLIISTGAGVAVPFIWAGKILGIKSVYIESITRLKRLSLSASLIYFITTKILVQWPELATRYKRTEYHGNVL